MLRGNVVMEPNDGAVSTSARAAELRASLGARRDVEALLAEASATRQAAAVDADAIVEEAQQLSEQLLAESRAEADRLLAAAQDRADAIVVRARSEADDATRQARSAAEAVRARAEADVEEHRRRVRHEVTEQVTRELEEHNRLELARQHERQDAMIGDLEASVRILGVSLDSATANVGSLLGALDGLRAHTAEAVSGSGLSLVPDQPLPAETPPAPPRDAVPAVPPRVPAAPPHVDLRDDLFRPTLPPRDLTWPGELEPPSDDDEAPRSATEAFFRSAHLDHGDPPLPPLDDDEIGARYARDAMRATARARSRQDSETLGVSPERPSPSRRGPDERGADLDVNAGPGAAGASVERSEGADQTGKPLGWLFRSP